MTPPGPISGLFRSGSGLLTVAGGTFGRMELQLLRTAAFIGLIGAVPVTAAGQDPVAPPPAIRPITLHELVLNDGSRMYGSIEAEDAAEVTFRTLAGARVTARRADIQSLRRVAGSMVDGEFAPADPNGTRLFFTPTGRALKKGQTYLGIYEFFVPFVQVGITDRFSIGGGTPLLFGFDDEWQRPFWVTPKFQVLNSERTQLSLGALHAFDADGDGGGIAYAVMTHGDDVKSVTAGAGVAYASSGGTAPVIMIGAEGRVRRNMKAITENYLWQGGRGVVSAGVRFFGDKISADLALAVPIGASELFAFPIVNFVYVF